MKLYLSSEGLGNKKNIMEKWKKNNENKILVIPNSKDYVDEENTKKEKILEKCLPNYLEEDLKKLKEGIKNNVSYLDCLINELQGSINSAFIDGDITEKQCDYLYKKYIRMKE